MPEAIRNAAEHFALTPLSASEFAALPKDIADLLTERSEKYSVDHADGTRSLVMLTVHPEGALYVGRVIDVDGEKSYIGQTTFGQWGNVGEILGEPTISNMHTSPNPGVRRRGFAQRRALVVNQICKDRFGKRLHAGTDVRRDGESFFARLVEKGLAEEKVLPDGSKTYVLV